MRLVDESANGALGPLSGATLMELVLGSVVFALAVSLITARIIEYLHNNRIRRATRELVANELRINLEKLDNYDRQLHRVALGLDAGWPRPLLVTNALARALDPDVIALLSDTEQVNLGLLETHYSEFNFREDLATDDATSGFDALYASQNPQMIQLVQEFHEYHVRACATRMFLSYDLSRLGAVIVGALIVVLTEQAVYVLSPSIEMAESLRPTIGSRAGISSWAWRSSDLRRFPRSPGTVVVWRHNDADAVARDQSVLVIDGGDLSSFSVIDRENFGWARRRWLRFRQYRARVAISRATRRLARLKARGTWP